MFAVYFREVVVAAADNRGDQLWGFANFLAMGIVALASPVLGAIADAAGRKKTFLVLTTLQTVVATALLSLTGPGTVSAAIALYVVATVGFEAGYVFYNAFLPQISTPATIGRISGWGWGIGFVGGLTALVVCLPWIGSELRAADGSLAPGALADRRLAFLLVAVFHLVFALPAFFWLPEGRHVRSESLGALCVSGFRRVSGTLRDLYRHREVAKFVLASLCFTDAITTIIVFAATYATVTFGFTSGELVTLFVVMNVVAFPSTVSAGYLADRIGAKRTLVLSLLLWIAIVLVAFLARDRGWFWAMATGAAAGMGATQAVARSFMAEISPRRQSAEFFGFYVTSGKFASIFGPLLFGTISAWSGSQRLAVLSLLPLFVAGIVLLLRIDEREARRAAAAPPPPATA